MLNNYGAISATQAQWNATAVPVALDQLVLESDTGRFKIGDGVTLYPGLAYVPQTLAGANITNATALATGTNTLQTLANLGIKVALLSLFGGVSDGVTDNGMPMPGQTISPLQMMNNYLLALNVGFYEIEFAGQTFATSQPWTPPAECCPANGKLLALPSSAWTAGLTSSVVAPLMLTNSGVSPRNFTVDGGTVAPWCAVLTSHSGMFPDNLTLIRWAGSTLDENDKYSSGGLLIAGGKLNGGGDNVAHQFTNDDDQYDQQHTWSGYGLAFVGTADQHAGHWTVSVCGIPILVDENSYCGTMINCHPFKGIDNDNTILQDCVIIDYRGYNWDFTGFEFDSGAILININANTKLQSPPTPHLTIGPSTCIVGADGAAYPGIIRIRTTQQNTKLEGLNYNNIQVSPNASQMMEWLQVYGPRTATATCQASTNSSTIVLNDTSIVGTIAVGNLIQGFNIPTDTTVISGSYDTWQLSNEVSMVADTPVYFNSFTGSWDPSINVSAINSIPAAKTTITRYGMTETRMSNSNYGGFASIFGNLLGQRTASTSTSTALQTDSGCLINVNNPNNTFYLPNNLTQGTWFIIASNAPDEGITITAESGAKLNSTAQGSFTLGFDSSVLCVVIYNTTGTSASYAIISQGSITGSYGNGGPLVQNDHGAATYTIQISDLFGIVSANNTNVAFTLLNTASVGDYCYFSTNSSGTTINAGSAGATISGSSSAVISLEKGSLVLALVTGNVDGNSANWSILGNGVSINTLPPVVETVAASPATFTATQYGTIVQTGGTGSAVFRRPGSPNVSLPSINTTLLLSPGDQIINTYTVAPTQTFIPQ